MAYIQAAYIVHTFPKLPLPSTVMKMKSLRSNFGRSFEDLRVFFCSNWSMPTYSGDSCVFCSVPHDVFLS